MRTIKNVQAFLSFVNLYWRFIHKYFNLIQLLIALIRQKNKEKSLSRIFNKSKDKVFQELKQAFAFIFILRHFDFNFKIWLKINVSDFVVTVIFLQEKLDELLYFVIYIFKIMFSIECNYEIYDKELLIIVWVFEK